MRPFLATWRAFQWTSRDAALGPIPPDAPVFPCQRGPRAGEAKQNSNVFAARLRRELKRAGVTRHELHNDTTTTRKADFHSTRRAYATALARIGLNEQQAMLFTGHSDAKVHRGYLNEMMLCAFPEAAVPMLEPAWALTVPNAKQPDNETSVFFGGRSRDRTCDFDRVKVALYR